MSFSPHIQSDARSVSLWSLSLGLLLLCGFVSLTAAAPRSANPFAVPLVVDQIEQLTLAGSTENLRVRPTLRRDGTAPENKETFSADGPAYADTATVLPIDGLSSRSTAYIVSSSDLPAYVRYALPASREPPKA